MNSLSFAVEEIGSIFRRPRGNLHLKLVKATSCTNEDETEKIQVPKKAAQQQQPKKKKKKGKMRTP